MLRLLLPPRSFSSRVLPWASLLALVGTTCQHPELSTTMQIIGDDDLRPVSAAALPPERYQLASQVGLLSGARPFATCSAIMIDGERFLTSAHCLAETAVEADHVCSRVRIKMGYEDGVPQADLARYQCLNVEYFDRFVDVALIAATLSQGHWDAVPLRLAQEPVAEGRRLWIVGHPLGRYKASDQSDQCAVVRAAVHREGRRPWIRHSCDMRSGGSGGALFDHEAGELVGIHVGASARHQEFNLAIDISLILEHLAPFPAPDSP